MTTQLAGAMRGTLVILMILFLVAGIFESYRRNQLDAQVEANLVYILDLFARVEALEMRGARCEIMP